MKILYRYLFHLGTLLIFMINYQAFAQNQNYWKNIVSPIVSKQNSTSTTFKHYQTFSLDREAFMSDLETASMRFSDQKKSTIIQIPLLNGKSEGFEVFRTEVLSSNLAEKFPKIKTYSGVSIHNPKLRLNLTTTPLGVFAMLLKVDGSSLFINPIQLDGDTYMLFDKRQAKKSQLNSMLCEAETMLEEAYSNYTDYTPEFVDNTTLKRYRLALACSSSYANFHLSEAGIPTTASTQQKLNAVLAAMVVTINRVNSIYERDIAVTLQLVGNNEDLIQLNSATDPYNDTFNDITVNQDQIDNTIGNNSYDIGHVFNTSGGGAASFQSVCNWQFKAEAFTGLPNPVGDPFDIDYVAHEIGHQFGASHTFNNECGGNRANSTAVEPGSGSTIMAYANVCPPNVQSASDAYFHAVSVSQMQNFISNSTGFNCAENIPISNIPPVIDIALTDFSIPTNTPFYLDVIAADADGDELTYTWEQLDNETNSPQPPLSLNFDGPNFRSFSPSVNSTRYFPNLNSLVNDIPTQWEVLPAVSRTMEFGVLVRDNNEIGGQSTFDSMDVSFVQGPAFEVTSQNQSGVVWVAGETETITWNVANTNLAPINSNTVDILLSTNSGQDFDVVLATDVPNNGSANIEVPNVFGLSCRVMVKSSDNIFFNVNTASFSIDSDAELECENETNSTIVSIPDGIGQNSPGDGVTSTINITDGINIESITVSVDISHTYIQDLGIVLQGPDAQNVVLFNRNCQSESGIVVDFNDLFSPIPDDCSDPLSGSYQPADGSLNQWLGTNAQGEWTLFIQDFWNQDTGQLNSWSIEICTTSLSTINQEANKFSIIPNPNNGKFQVNFSTLSGAEINGKLYNLQGRLIENLKLEPGILQQEVQFDNLQQGMYLFQINDGENTLVEKLIIR